jgi:PAS domain S-box-containing protein
MVKIGDSVDLEMLRAVLSASPYSHVLYRAEGPCRWANRRTGELIGATQDQVLQQNFREIQSWRRSGLLQAALDTLDSGLAVHHPVDVVSTFGKRAHLGVDLQRVVVGGQPHLLLTMSDITDLIEVHHKVEAARVELERSRAEFRAIVEAHASAILVLDADDRVLFANPTAGVMLDADVETLHGRVTQRLDVTGRGPDISITRSDGVLGCAVLRESSTHWDGKPARLVCLHDVTDLRRAEEELHQRGLELAQVQKREALGRLAGEVAHNLNNQLTVLRGHLELLEETTSCETSRRRFDTLFASLQCLESLGRGVMEYGRRQPEVPLEPAVNAPLEENQAATILLAEDEAQLRAMVAEALRALGYRVLEAADGAEALELALAYTEPIDLLLSDVVMPGLDGCQLHEALIEHMPELEVLYMSGFSQSDDPRLFQLAAEGHYVQKPFSLRHLARKLRQLLED